MKPALEFDAKAMEKLMNYHYPGNVRELQYTIERAVIMADDNDSLQANDLIFSPIESSPQYADETAGNETECC